MLPKGLSKVAMISGNNNLQSISTRQIYQKAADTAAFEPATCRLEGQHTGLTEPTHSFYNRLAYLPNKVIVSLFLILEYPIYVEKKPIRLLHHVIA
jgi:hypothetical protein